MIPSFAKSLEASLHCTNDRFETNEPPVPVADTDILIVRPANPVMGLSRQGPEVHVRTSVQQRLAMAATSLPLGLTLVAFDGWRSLATQKALVECLSNVAAQCGQDPSEFLHDPEAPLTQGCHAGNPPDCTDGAVDVRLADANGVFLNIGTEFEELSDRSATVFFEDGQLGYSGTNRRLPYAAMLSQGSTNHQKEWRHHGFCNALWQRYGQQTQSTPHYPLARHLDEVVTNHSDTSSDQ